MAAKKKAAKTSEKTVYFEAALKSATESSIFDEEVIVARDNLREFAPPPGRGSQAARALKALGFTVRHVGTFSISGEGSRRLWEKVFKTKVERRRQPISDAHPRIGRLEYYSHIADTGFQMPKKLDGLVERAYPQRPPTFYISPLPPRVAFHHLRVPADVAMLLRSEHVHKEGITGDSVLVAMVDTGFYRHPFYGWHGYNYNATLAPDATDLDTDANGHGTAEAANIFANAPDIDFIGVKMGGNPTLAFKTASDLHPAVMTNSWGYSLQNPPVPNFLKPLETAVIEAVSQRGITVCFSAGNGHFGWPGQMPQVISVGGVYAHETVSGDDFDLEASNYASSFDSNIYAGRHVPDVCGLVGMQPSGVYIMLPVPPNSAIDSGLAGASFPNKDETARNDGWAVISGTSASSPQIAGVCALLKQAQPGLSPELVKSILKASARDVTAGRSNHGQPAGPGHDGATGAGLVDAQVAYQLARSVQIRSVFDLPPPR
ncbi:MAG: S8 family serine peptidase [Gammaproteobacteria bacterium]|nr:S8 family serine peptidase [Gammaproteobacteria bacterium]